MTRSYIDPYAVLGLSRTASSDEIKRAYFAQVRAHPPERAPEMFKQIRAAYEQLRDVERRAETDMLLLNQWPEPTRKRRLPAMDLAVQPEDVVMALRSLSDVERSDWREYYKKVEL